MAKVQLLEQTDMTESDGDSAYVNPNNTTAVFEFSNSTIPAHMTMFGVFALDGSIGTAHRIQYDNADFNHSDNLLITGLNYTREDVHTWISYFSDPINAFFPRIFEGADQFFGSPYGDVIVGFDGRDTLFGFGGPDQMGGGDGADLLVGGMGKDTLENDPGADRFDYNAAKESRPGAASRDIILFFSHAEHDKVDLRTIDANTRFAGNQKFEFIGTRAFTGNAGDPQHRGELRYIDLGASVIVQGDVNGDRVADFEIDVRIGAVVTGDFIL